jgi:uncharacterized protein (UPF0147 family)
LNDAAIDHNTILRSKSLRGAKNAAKGHGISTMPRVSNDLSVPMTASTVIAAIVAVAA